MSYFVVPTGTSELTDVVEFCAWRVKPVRHNPRRKVFFFIRFHFLIVAVKLARDPAESKLICKVKAAALVKNPKNPAAIERELQKIRISCP